MGLQGWQRSQVIGADTGHGSPRQDGAARLAEIAGHWCGHGPRITRHDGVARGRGGTFQFETAKGAGSRGARTIKNF
jgi:hypothetical protein